MPSLSCTIASGNWGNRKIGSGFGVYGEQAVVKKGLSAKQHNFSLHAGVWVADDQPKKLRQLIGYVSRAPLARERLEWRRGKVELTLKRPWQDGTHKISFEPYNFLKSLAAIVPSPWTNQVRYWGVFGANHRWRHAICKAVVRRRGYSRVSYRIPWAQLLRHSFAKDLSYCQRCNAPTRVISVITERRVINRILRSMRISSLPPPLVY